MADQALRLLRRVIAHPTIAGEPNGELIADVADELERAGAEVATLPAHRADAVNLHAVIGPADVPGGLLVAAHSDVVGVDGQPWARDPFTLYVELGRAYGRGTADMKGFLATALAAVAHLIPDRMRRPLHIAVSCDEEVGCRGVRPLLDTVAGLPVAPGKALVGEPTMMRVVNRHKGKSAVRVHLRGRAAHSSLAPDGVNAVAYAGRLITELLALQHELAAGPGDRAYAVPFATVGIGPIHGGVSVNIVPDRCDLELEVRALPEQNPEQLIERIRELAGGLEREMRGAYADADIALEPMSSYPGLRPAADEAFAAEVARRTGHADIGAADFGTEAGLYQQRLGIPVVVCGPGSMTDAHQADESVAIEQLDRSERLIRELAEALYAD